jgi:uncharacterized Zn-finger protein
MSDFEIIEATENEVACNGGKSTLGHPTVYLYIKKEKGSVVCPYCSRKFVLKNHGN